MAASNLSESDIAKARGVPIDVVIGRYVELKRKGRELFARCPFHNERTGSFHVVPARGFYHCFGCGAHGGVINFIQQQENLSFPEAVRFLAGNIAATTPRPPAAPPPARDKTAIVKSLWESARRESLVEFYLYT